MHQAAEDVLDTMLEEIIVAFFCYNLCVEGPRAVAPGCRGCTGHHAGGNHSRGTLLLLPGLKILKTFENKPSQQRQKILRIFNKTLNVKIMYNHLSVKLTY